jgi:hypothetical protein
VSIWFDREKMRRELLSGEKGWHWMGTEEELDKFLDMAEEEQFRAMLKNEEPTLFGRPYKVIN